MSFGTGIVVTEMVADAPVALCLRHYGGAVWRRTHSLLDHLDPPVGVARWLYQPGPPAGLERDRLNEALQSLGYGRCRNVWHRHISRWKRAGAYRLCIESKDERTVRLVYKDAWYSQDDFPALEDLHLSPGYGEYAVYHFLASPDTRFLPTVLLAEEVEPKRHYRYLMADLSLEHRRCGTRPSDLIHVCECLPALQSELQTLTEQDLTTPLIAFDHEFALQLLDYANENLGAYAASHPDSVVAALVSKWASLSDTYRRGAEQAYACQPMTLIHGDYNTDNIMVGQGEEGPIKAVDFEWCGWGLPQMDLASALKGAPSELCAHCVASFARRWGATSTTEQQQSFEFCAL